MLSWLAAAVILQIKTLLPANILKASSSDIILLFATVHYQANSRS